LTAGSLANSRRGTLEKPSTGGLDAVHDPVLDQLELGTIEDAGVVESGGGDVYDIRMDGYEKKESA
jgi:hypothetical protein